MILQHNLNMLFNINIIQKSFLIFFKNNDENNNNNNLDLNLDWYLMPNPSSSQIPNPRDFLCFVVGVIVSFTHLYFDHNITSLKARQSLFLFLSETQSCPGSQHSETSPIKREHFSVSHHSTILLTMTNHVTTIFLFMNTTEKLIKAPPTINTCKLARRG